MKININNFQSLQKAEIDLTGLVGVVGQNNSGKTAIIRAVRDFVLNGFTKEKITQGESTGTIQIDDITMTRTANSTTVKTTTEELTKLSGKPLPTVIQLKDFLYINNDKIEHTIPQFTFQREAVFPFDLSNSQIYYLFSMLFDMETLNKMAMDIKQKQKANDDEVKVLKVKLDETLKTEINLNEQYMPDVSRIEKLEQRYTGIIKLLEIIGRYEELQNKPKKEIYMVKTLELALVCNRLNQLKVYDMSKTKAILNYLELLEKQKELEAKVQAFRIDGKKILLVLELLEKNKALKSVLQTRELLEITLKEKTKAFEDEFKTCPLCGK